MADFAIVSRYGFWNSAGGTLLIFFVSGCLIGTLLLSLPISHTVDASILDMLFTATSAITVTGLTTLNTATDFTILGQAIIAILIQMGGLGYMLIGTLLLLGHSRFISLRQQSTMGITWQINAGVSLFRLARFVIIFSVVMVALTTLLLSIYWIPAYGAQAGLGRSLFHAISAFNNAGFTLFIDSLETVSGGDTVILIHALAFIIGGLGFIVIYEVLTLKKPLSIHTRIMIYGSLGFLVIGTLGLMLFEYKSNSLGEGHSRITAAFFQIATTRTAGFNSVDLTELSSASHVLMMVNMVIGAGPGSTAGGIRLTTFVLLIAGLFAVLRGRYSTRLLGRTLDVEHLLRASGILILTLIVLTVSCILLLFLEDNHNPLAIVFEVVSALGTVGLSLGITPDLQPYSKILIIIVMLIGKISPIILFTALAHRPEQPIRYAGGRIALG